MFPRLPVNWRPLTSGQSFHCYAHRNRRCTPMRLCNMRPTDNRTSLPQEYCWLSYGSHQPLLAVLRLHAMRVLRAWIVNILSTTHSQAHYVSCSGDMLRHVTTMCKRLDFTFHQQYRIPRYSQGFQATTKAGQAIYRPLLSRIYTHTDPLYKGCKSAGYAIRLHYGRSLS